MNISSTKLSTPVVLILAPRIETVTKVLAVIKEANPSVLYVIADAGWSPITIEKFKEVKALIAQINWCEVHTNYANENMNAKMRIASGISWVFEYEERAIILEHDCLPDQSFFPYCENLLEYYANDNRVMHIGGNNFFKQLNLNYKSLDSYFFTHIPHIWGFATWRRAWQYYDVNIIKWPQAQKRKLLYDIFKNDAVVFRWENRLQEYYENRINSWDGQWTFAVLSQGGLSINPNVNLVSNIGFGPEALSCKNEDDSLANIPSESIVFPLKHPPFMIVDQEADNIIQRDIFCINKTWIQRIKWYLKKSCPQIYKILKILIKRY